jgi:uncharacterized protein (AIM24 family)
MLVRVYIRNPVYDLDDNGINMETNMKGGFMKGLGRVFSGDSLFIATYTANQNNQEIVIAIVSQAKSQRLI